jgi:restriction endonuclease Mrr
LRTPASQIKERRESARAIIEYVVAKAIERSMEVTGSYKELSVLIDGRRLAELMIEHNIGVVAEQPYIIKKIDSDYFEE